MLWFKKTRKVPIAMTVDWQSLQEVRSILQDQDAMMDAWQQDLTTLANSMVDWFREEHGIPVNVAVCLSTTPTGNNKADVLWMLEFIFPKDINISLNKVSWFQNYFLPNAFAGMRNLAWRVTYTA